MRNTYLIRVRKDFLKLSYESKKKEAIHRLLVEKDVEVRNIDIKFLYEPHDALGIEKNCSVVFPILEVEVW